jgi:hypothetical protein
MNVPPPEPSALNDTFLEKFPPIQIGQDTYIRVLRSNKSAVPDGVPGGHFIVTVAHKENEITWRPLAFSEVEGSPGNWDSKAYVRAKEFAQIASKALGFSGSFRILQNGPALATRDEYHLHVIIVADKQTLASLGWEPVRLIDPAGSFQKTAV